MPAECDCSRSECRCRGGDVRGAIQPRILLELARGPACGYDLLEALKRDPGGAEPDTGNLYRTLRWMEQSGCVKSDWETSRSGPARRVYEITPTGWEHLDEWAEVLGRTRRWLDDFLEGYTSLRRIYERI